MSKAEFLEDTANRHFVELPNVSATGLKFGH
jgi:hypothetical protein